MNKLSEKKKVMGVGFTIDSQDKILEYIGTIVEKGGPKTMIFTPNPEMLLLARRDTQFKTVLNSADIALPDGVGVVMASRFLKSGIAARIAGVDFIEMLIKTLNSKVLKSAKQQVSIGFIGGREKVAEKAAVCLQNSYKETRFFVYDGNIDAKNFTFSMTNFKEILDGKVSEQGTKKLDLLFVAFGFPTQEKWINANLPHIPVSIAMGVGGSFDIISGKIKRAPKVLQKSGLEWSWRLVRQPWRIKRQLRLIQYPYFILRERILKI